jgi:hypothetical protein
MDVFIAVFVRKISNVTKISSVSDGSESETAIYVDVRRPGGGVPCER